MAAARINLHEADAALHQAAGHQTAAAELFGLGVVQSVQRLRFGRFLVEVDRFGRRGLHAERQLVRRQPRGERAVVCLLSGRRLLVQLPEQVQLLTLLRRADTGRRPKINQCVTTSAKLRPLK